MEMKKYEELIEVVVNENIERANELIHEIIVEKSREIYESIMAEDDEDDLDESMGGQVGDLLDEINTEEEGMNEEEDDEEVDFDLNDIDGDDDVEFDSDEMLGDESADEVEDAVIRIEDKLDQLMAEFESIMSGDEDDLNDESDFGDNDSLDNSDVDSEDDFGSNEMMESAELQKVSLVKGDNGAQTKSPTAFNSGSKGMDSKPVSFSGRPESSPSGPKKPSNAYTKGEGMIKGADNFKNSPGKGNFSEKGETAPKPKFGDDGVNTKSPVSESRRPLRRPIK